MDNPHTERGSQDYYSIHRKQILSFLCGQSRFWTSLTSEPSLFSMPCCVYENRSFLYGQSSKVWQQYVKWK
ncbi:hypothetical protein ATANTOWER_027239 [Ataeniobius toweri]|uniref:Uncharacterized protein n=1 Tax=Ataeniobius toweri TaxID=208326 RepID=A0ABU7BKG3_9TELE|nr:hypothetical protein [Ataeniobius toweri]